MTDPDAAPADLVALMTMTREADGRSTMELYEAFSEYLKDRDRSDLILFLVGVHGLLDAALGSLEARGTNGKTREDFIRDIGIISKNFE